MELLKIIFVVMLILLGLTLGVMFLPLIIGGVVAYVKFGEGEIIGGIIAGLIGLLLQWLMFKLFYSGIDFSSGEDEEDCPYCGSGDIDGNHCYDCDEDF